MFTDGPLGDSLAPLSRPDLTTVSAHTRQKIWTHNGVLER